MEARGTSTLSAFMLSASRAAAVPMASIAAAPAPSRRSTARRTTASQTTGPQARAESGVSLALGEQDRVLGVIYDSSASDNAGALHERLRESGIPYQSFNLATVDSLEDLQPYTFLFLFYLQALEQPYAMQTWEHRLQMLEILLNYGERTVLEQGRDLRADRR